jgi:protein O-mannosyl-transferase
MTQPRDNRVIILCLILVVATLAFYNPIAHNRFVDFDDQHYILNNYHIHNGVTWEAVKWSFSTFRDANYHPLTWLSHALDCQLYGLNPVGHHYTNLFLHAFNAVLLFLLLRRATDVTWPSLIVAALFAVHPVNVESVAWAAERKNVLSMTFFLLALYAYARYGCTGKRYLYWSVAALFVCGLLAKAQVVTLPFVLLLWDFWPLQRMKTGGNARTTADTYDSVPAQHSIFFLLWEKTPFLLLAATGSVVTVYAQRAGVSIRTLSDISLSLRVENAIVSYVRYIGKAIWPTRLALLYPRPENLFPDWQVLGSVALLLLVSALALRWRNERPYLLFGWCWFLGALVPMIGIVTVGEQAMADRYAYIPYIGLFIAAIWLLADLTSRYKLRSEWLTATAICVVLIFGTLTYFQTERWHDSETIWRYALSVTQRNYMAHSNLALALGNQGRFEESIAELKVAESIHKYPPAQILSMALYELRYGHEQDAISVCQSMLHSTDPSAADSKIQSVAWSELGQAHLQLRQYDQADEGYKKALRLNPEDAMALAGLGVIALRQQQPAAAVDDLLHSVKVEPNDVNVLLLAEALRRAGRPAEANAAAAQVQKISSDPAQAQTAAGQILAWAGVQPL